MANWFEEPWYANAVVARSKNAYRACVAESTQDDPDPTATYERDYGPFERRIAKVLLAHGAPKQAMRFFDDWSPNRTRIVTCEERYVTPAALAALGDLLRNKYEYWRIEVVLVRSIEQDAETGMVSFTRNLAICYRRGTKLVTAVRKLKGSGNDRQARSDRHRRQPRHRRGHRPPPG